IKRRIAPFSHRCLPTGVGARNELGLLPFLGQYRALDVRDRLPTLQLASNKIDNCFVNGATAASDDERLPGKGLSRLPSEHIGLWRLIEIDQSKPGLRVDFAGFAQYRNRSRDLLG